MTAPKPWSLREVHVYPSYYYLELLDANGKRIVATNTFPGVYTEKAMEEIVKMSQERMTDHTPAPWIYRPDTADILTSNDDDMTLRIAYLDYDPNIPPEQVKANARLIAAAPDMLDVLRHISNEAYRTDNSSPDMVVSQDRIAQVRDVIVKAEGRD